VSRRSNAIAKSGIGSWTSKGDCTPNPDTRNPEIISTVHQKGHSGSRSKRHQNFGISEFGISEVLLTKVGTLHGESPEIPKRSQSSIRWDTWRRSRKPSVFRLPGFQVDRGFVSPGVASREIAKRRRTVHLEETRGSNPGFREIFRKEKDSLPFRHSAYRYFGGQEDRRSGA
jgi:hypothetical protein